MLGHSARSSLLTESAAAAAVAALCSHCAVAVCLLVDSAALARHCHLLDCYCSSFAGFRLALCRCRVGLDEICEVVGIVGRTLLGTAERTYCASVRVEKGRAHSGKEEAELTRWSSYGQRNYTANSLSLVTSSSRYQG
jgi:hypothetical protein